MSFIKRILCLAISRKQGGFCVAGVAQKGLSCMWIRPISNRQNHEIISSELVYEKGDKPKLLDIIYIPVLKHHPHHHQQENWLLNPTKHWRKAGVFEWHNLHKLMKTYDALWEDGYHDNKDRVTIFEANYEVDSLRLIYVKELMLRCERNAKKRWGIRGYFRYSNKDYALKVTDPHIEKRYRNLRSKDHRLGECFLTISLSEPFGELYYEYCYKLIAAVMQKPQ